MKKMLIVQILFIMFLTSSTFAQQEYTLATKDGVSIKYTVESKNCGCTDAYGKQKATFYVHTYNVWIENTNNKSVTFQNVGSSWAALPNTGTLCPMEAFTQMCGNVPFGASIPGGSYNPRTVGPNSKFMIITKFSSGTKTNTAPKPGYSMPPFKINER